MASRLNPYINFDGTARQALEFYRDVFGGELLLTTFGQFPGADAADAEKIMHGQLETPSGYTLMAADTPPDWEIRPGNTMTISLSGDDAAELHGYWERLAEGGTITIPLEKQMWGDEFGQCLDRFGVSWMVNITQPQS
ncbi:VOC family protein [Phytohabitans kaempferiae]|uniref:VOC family protein n=1 Tax=Phytohabitans kaempferiae TaxID=1620943 RepID=A0ABV6M2D1_9ACTN